VQKPENRRKRIACILLAAAIFLVQSPAWGFTADSTYQIREHDSYGSGAVEYGVTNTTSGLNLTSDAASIGYLYTFAVFNRTWLQNLQYRIEIADYTGIELWDGTYDRKSTTDFPSGSEHLDKGKGTLETIAAWADQGAGTWYNGTITSAIDGNQTNATLVVFGFDNNNGGIRNGLIKHFWIQDQTGTILWKAPLGESNDFLWPEGQAGDAYNEYGRITASVADPTFYVTNATVNWTTTTTALLTIKFSDPVNEVIVFYGTGDYAHLDHRKTLTINSPDAGPFYIGLHDLTPGTTYNWTVWPNWTASSRIEGNFTTRSGLIERLPRWFFDNQSNGNIGWNYNFHPWDRNISSPTDPWGYYSWWSNGEDGATDALGFNDNYDAGSTGDLYFQGRFGIFMPSGQSFATDNMWGLEFWGSGGDNLAWAVKIYNSSTDNSLHWTFYSWNDGGWVDYDNISAPQLNRFYNVTVQVKNGARWSVQDGNNDFWRFKVDGGIWSSWIKVSDWVGDDWFQVGQEGTGTISTDGSARFVVDFMTAQNATFSSLDLTFQQDPPSGGGSGSSNTAPTLNSPSDITMVEGDHATIGWIVTDAENATGSYSITKNGDPWSSGTWLNGTSLDVSLDGLAPGTWKFVITASDGIDSASDTVFVTVKSGAGSPSAGTGDDGMTGSGQGSGGDWNPDPYHDDSGSGPIEPEPPTLPELPPAPSWLEMLFEAMRRDLYRILEFINWLMSWAVTWILLILGGFFFLVLVSERRDKTRREMKPRGAIGGTIIGKMPKRWTSPKVKTPRPPRPPKPTLPKMTIPKMRIPKFKFKL